MIRPISCVVLAGGKGTRALATGDRTPKVLRSVGAGESLLYNAVTRALAIAGEVIVTVGPFRDLLESSLPVSTRIKIIDDFGTGNGNALFKASLSAQYENIMVMNADTINDIPYGPFVDIHLDRNFGASILLSRSKNVQNPGAYLVRSDGLVLHSFESESNIVNTHDFCNSYWQGASTGILLYPTRELMAMSVIETAVVEKTLLHSLLRVIIYGHTMWVMHLPMTLEHRNGLHVQIYFHAQPICGKIED